MEYGTIMDAWCASYDETENIDQGSIPCQRLDTFEPEHGRNPEQECLVRCVKNWCRSSCELYPHGTFSNMEGKSIKHMSQEETMGQSIVSEKTLLWGWDCTRAGNGYHNYGAHKFKGQNMKTKIHYLPRVNCENCQGDQEVDENFIIHGFRMMHGIKCSLRNAFRQQFEWQWGIEITKKNPSKK